MLGLASRARQVITRLFGPQTEGAAGELAGPVLYDEDAFLRRECYRANYKTLCDALDSVIQFETILDLGCANGFVLEGMHSKGKTVRGVELSSAALTVLPAAVRDRVQIADATALGHLGTFDLVSCIEVAEHIPPERSVPLVDTITANAGRWVYFTAAPPYQPGRGHINCRPHFFWMNEFRKRGFVLDWERTDRFIELISGLDAARWLPLNSLIFQRA